jgi:DNA-binding NarL/FixJ family response regulator
MMKMNDQEKTIFIAEGEKHVRMALRLMLDNEESLMIVGEASTPESLIAQVCRQSPDIILLDGGLPGLHPQRLITVIKKCCPEARIVITSVRPEIENTMMEIGADAFLPKQLLPDEYIGTLLSIIDK